ncbi:hypothetical protein UFOVP238_6 [uncultured Caudovirales phage]|uniref:Terminase n=1 Tax=uncultured Caudovirales phage TaxID=2100421 RepID=A0A6J7WQQ7_9CAUD|nr:hypothetical protein UFOVP238_6 [uncultured Caudovirales phage]
MANRKDVYLPKTANGLVFQRWPKTPDELWWWVFAVLGVRIPRVQICPDHKAPFDAFCDAFFATSPVSIWKASRGFGGKSYLLALLSTTEAIVLGAESSVLGGSASQSLNVHHHSQSFWSSPYAPRQLLAGDPSAYQTQLVNGANIRALTASSRSVRGPHPQRLRLDEIDEMELEILEAAQGQPMSKRGIKAQTVMSSTHQYPDKTMSAMLTRAKDKGWPVFEWCWRESMGTPAEPGWLTLEDVDRKRAEVPERFWLVEYDLQAPSFDGRAFESEAVDEMFIGNLMTDENGEEIIFEQPDPTCSTYITGVDWAKEKDWTIIWTFDTRSRPWKTVAWERVNKQRWPQMVDRVSHRVLQYPGVLVHDATGLGNVIKDLLELPRRHAKVIDVVMAGRSREVLFNEYISAVEENEMTCPKIDFPYHEHLYCVRNDLFKVGGHPPDSVVAAALAWSARNEQRSKMIPAPSGLVREKSPWLIPTSF